VHEAISHQPSDHPEGAISAVWQRGYRLGDRVVRAARVVVSSGPSEHE
jgi:molecular chaperone GrpE